jgi:hypothetical protein
VAIEILGKLLEVEIYFFYQRGKKLLEKRPHEEKTVFHIFLQYFFFKCNYFLFLQFVLAINLAAYPDQYSKEAIDQFVERETKSKHSISINKELFTLPGDVLCALDLQKQRPFSRNFYSISLPLLMLA